MNKNEKFAPENYSGKSKRSPPLGELADSGVASMSLEDPNVQPANVTIAQIGDSGKQVGTDAKTLQPAQQYFDYDARNIKLNELI